MAEEEPKVKEDWMGCPGAVKAVLPKKIRNAVKFALDECLLEMVGTPEAQRNQWVYKEIKKRIQEQMKIWITEAMDEAIKEALK